MRCHGTALLCPWYKSVIRLGVGSYAINTPRAFGTRCINRVTTSPSLYNLYLPTSTIDNYKLYYLDIYIEIKERKFKTSVYDKRDAFKFHIVSFPFLDSNIPTKPAYRVYISQLVRIGRICGQYEDHNYTDY